MLNNHINQTRLACRLANQSSCSTRQGLPSQRGTVPDCGHSRGDQPGHGQHHPTCDTPRDVTDPSIWLTQEQYSQLSLEQHRARYERLQPSVLQPLHRHAMYHPSLVLSKPTLPPLIICLSFLLQVLP